MNPVQIFKKAKKEHYAIGQFNVSTDEQIRAIVEIAQNLKSPVIIGTSEGEREFLGLKQAVALVNSWQVETKLPIILNADHCKTFESAKQAIDAGYSAVHLDGSKLDFKKNVELTKKVVKYAQKKNPNLLVEGELGYLRGGSKIHKKIKVKLDDLTKPEEAKRFIKETGVHSLAVVVGNIHGVEISLKNPPLYLQRIKEIQAAAPKTFLVLHGGSGTSNKDIKQAIKQGIVKININTELRIAYSKKLREEIEKHPEQIKPYKFLIPSVRATKKIVKKKIKLFGSQSKA